MRVILRIITKEKLREQRSESGKLTPYHQDQLDHCVKEPVSEIQSSLSKSVTFGAGTKCPSKRDVRLIESQIKGVKKGRDQL